MSSKFKPGSRVRFKNSNGVFIEGIVAQYRGDIHNNGTNIVRVIYGEDQEYSELPESEIILLPKSTPAMNAIIFTCSTCKDSHKMWVESKEQYFPCTMCPTPCSKCARGAYCAATPCRCDCHRSKNQPSSRPANKLQPQIDVQTIIRNAGMQKVLESLIESLVSEEEHTQQLKIDLELALFNYKNRYKEDD